MSRSLD